MRAVNLLNGGWLICHKIELYNWPNKHITGADGCPFRSFLYIQIVGNIYYSFPRHQTSCQELAKTCQDPDERQTVRKDTPNINHRLPRGIAKPGSRGRRCARRMASSIRRPLRGARRAEQDHDIVNFKSRWSPHTPPPLARTRLSSLQKSIF